MKHSIIIITLLLIFSSVNGQMESDTTGKRIDPIARIISENNANGIKDIYWDGSRWVVEWVGRGLKPNYYKTFVDVMKMVVPDKGH